jgi:hypothetical protein
MTMRFKYNGTAGGGISTASIGQGGALTHGLAATPDEWWIAQHGLSVSYFIAASAPDSTNVYVSTASAGALCSVFAAVNHSLVK